MQLKAIHPTILSLLFWTLSFGQDINDLDVFAKRTGNPIIPAYLADASLFYDQQTKSFYAYGTNDGSSGENVFPTQVWYSKDGKNWKNQIVALPRSWTDHAGKKYVWAPSIIYHPKSHKYYLMYSIDSKVFIAMSDHALGPWQDANGAAPGKMFYKGYDGQFFLDDDGSLYVTTDAREFKIIKFRFNHDGELFFDQNDQRFEKLASTEFSGSFRYALISNLKNAFEASYLYKRKGLYYLMWSFEGSENYNVRYAVSENLTGPYREINGSLTTPILARNDKKHILGPGHHSMLDFEGRTFIAYHRQHYPFIDSKRQTCIDEVFFNSDGSIKTVIPTHRGVALIRAVTKLKYRNLALGCSTITSASRRYDSSPYEKRYRTHDLSFSFTGNFAVDENYGTRWDAGVGEKTAWIIVDLGSDRAVDHIQTMFEYTSRNYKYKLEMLRQADAKNLPDATQKTKWVLFSDKTLNGIEKSPVTDHSKSRMVGRFVRLTIVDVIDLPFSADPLDPTNAQNGLSIFELKIFGR